MASNREEFDIALGQCTVRDGRLHIDRPDLEELGRLELARKGVARNLEYRPRYTIVILGAMLILGAIFVAAIVSLYTSNPAVAPLVVGLVIVGIFAVGVPLERAYRRALGERRTLRRTLADEFPLVQTDQIDLGDVTEVTERHVSTDSLLDEGSLYLVHFQHDGDEAVTYLGFPAFMTDEKKAARAVFDEHGVPVPGDDQRSA